jgi:hypothetical protein
VETKHSTGGKYYALMTHCNITTRVTLLLLGMPTVARDNTYHKGVKNLPTVGFPEDPLRRYFHLAVDTLRHF